MIKSNDNPFIGLGDEYTETSGVPITPNTWQHCVVTYDGLNAKVYVNAGVPWNSGNIGLKNFGSSNTRIGRSVTDSREFNGIIDEVRIYNRTLSEDAFSTISFDKNLLKMLKNSIMNIFGLYISISLSSTVSITPFALTFLSSSTGKNKSAKTDVSSVTIIFPSF